MAVDMTLSGVMPGLVPGIHVFGTQLSVYARRKWPDKPGHDDII
jgi:hypothetical protein